MPDIRGMSHDCQPRRETVSIDTCRILDSCKDKDCFEDTKLILTDYAQELVEKGSSVRVVSTELVWTDITVTPVKFNKGFYQVGIRYYTKIVLEVCLSMGKVQEIEGIAVNDKTVVLYGGCGSVTTFRKVGTCDDFCMRHNDEVKTTSDPTVVVEVVDPIALSVKVAGEMPKCCSVVCCCEELPSCVLNCLSGNPCHMKCDKYVYVSLGFFSIVRMERPAQLLVQATEYAVPDKVCRNTGEEDPCEIFAKMAFPSAEFTSGCCHDH